MQKRHARTLCKMFLCCAALASLQACTDVAAPGAFSVADAYRASDAVAVSPYTRTIFSSNNF